MSSAESMPPRLHADARSADRSPVDAAVAGLADAANRGQLALFAVASVVLKDLLDARSLRILVYSGGVWRPWDGLEATDSDVEEDLPPQSAAWDTIVEIDDGLFVPVRAGSVALVLAGMARHAASASAETAATLLRLALAACEEKHGNPDKLEAIRAFQRVAGRILQSQDLPEVLLQITHEAKTRLSADICGIMLLEDDELVMRRCVGNLSIETAKLRMRQGQGVAGRVLQTRAPCGVEDYVRSDVISRDFFNLARSERVRSALAAPVMSKDEVVGVLEVWRRRPSTFTSQHTAELVTLANLASIAIDTVQLVQARESVVAELADANAALRNRYEVIVRSASLQEAMTRALLEGRELAGIAAEAHASLGAPVVILDTHMTIEAAFPADACDAGLHGRIRTAIGRGAAADTRLTVKQCGTRAVAWQPIVAGSERFGWVVVFDQDTPQDSPDESIQLAVSQICTMSALCKVKQRAAARARSDKLASVLWDLVDGPDNVRRLAIERAQDLGISLCGGLRALVCDLAGAAGDGDATPSAAVDIERRRRLVAEAALDVVGAEPVAAGTVVRLAAARGDAIAIVCEGGESAAVVKHARLLARQLAEHLPDLRIHIGISTPIDDAMNLAAAVREARIAASVARQSGKGGVVSYAEAGVAGMLMGARDEADLHAFVATTLGPLLGEPAARRDLLLTTLRAFFAANCCRQAAADHLRVHQKTMSYRLDKITSLTGLDLSRHDHRLQTDLALRMHEIVAKQSSL